ncbi:hypothetical protein D0C17_13310 [Vibrio cholerae]|nr:hypothetical protein [Vibrio cholerae]
MTFERKLILGICIVLICTLGTILSFIFAFTMPKPSDTQSAIETALAYRWFVIFLVSMLSSLGVTSTYYYKYCNQC